MPALCYLRRTMKRLIPTGNAEQWPRKAVNSIETRKRDLVIRISDWTRQSAQTGEPAYDVEVYVGGVYDYDLSKLFPTASAGKTKAEAKAQAIQFAQEQIAALL